MAKKMLAIGLDGATFNVINPLIEENYMPNVKGLINEGASGVLQSTMPPVTGPAWLAMATGLTPGKTGIYDFIKRNGEGGYKFTWVNSSDYKGRAIWDYLSNSGKRVGVVDFPHLYPPYKVNGFLVSGGLGSPKESNFTYPEELERELDHVRILNLINSKYKDLNIFIDDLNDVFKKRVNRARYLLEKKEWDLFWVVFPETDWIQHMMRRFIDVNPSSCDKIEFKKYNEKFKQFWGEVDKVIGEFRDIVGKETNVMIVSDHGFGPCYNQCFKLNTWLKHEGYLKPKKNAGIIFWALKIGKIFNRIFPGLIHWRKKLLLLQMMTNSIDLEKSIAFDPGHIGTFGGVYINDYMIKDSATKEMIKKEISKKLYRYGKEKGLDFEIYTPEKLYGNKPKNSLDLIIRVNKGGCMVEKWEFEGKVIDKLPARKSFLSGTHRMDGVFIGKGPDFLPCKVENARIWDIAPTILQCFNEPIPSSMEGVVLKETLKHKETFIYEKEEIKVSKESRKTLSKDEEARIKKQLSDLGYS